MIQIHRPLSDVDRIFIYTGDLLLILYNRLASMALGNTDTNTYEDGIYGQFLDSRFGGDGTDFSHYMMGVSPWFFTNLPGYDKNWLWRGDSLWYDRWQQYVDSPFV